MVHRAFRDSLHKYVGGTGFVPTLLGSLLGSFLGCIAANSFEIDALKRASLAAMGGSSSALSCLLCCCFPVLLILLGIRSGGSMSLALGTAAFSAGISFVVFSHLAAFGISGIVPAVISVLPRCAAFLMLALLIPLGSRRQVSLRKIALAPSAAFLAAYFSSQWMEDTLLQLYHFVYS